MLWQELQRSGISHPFEVQGRPPHCTLFGKQCSGWEGTLAAAFPALSTLPISQPQTGTRRDAGPPWHLPGSGLLRAELAGYSPLLPTQTNPRLPSGSAPTAPGKNTAPHPSAPCWEGRLFLLALRAAVSLTSQAREGLKGSAEVPSLRIFPVSSHPCLPHQWSTSGVPNPVGISSSTHLAFSPQA